MKQLWSIIEAPYNRSSLKVKQISYQLDWGMEVKCNKWNRKSDYKNTGDDDDYDDDDDGQQRANL